MHIHKLMLMMQGYWTYRDWSSEYPMATAIMDDARADNYNPYALLLHNRSHHPPNDKKHGGLCFRSFAQWLKAMQTSTRSLNDY